MNLIMMMILRLRTQKITKISKIKKYGEIRIFFDIIDIKGKGFLIWENTAEDRHGG